MNIVFIVSELGYGGQERQMSYAINELLKEGHHVRLVVWLAETEKFSKAYGINQLKIQIHFLTGNSRLKIKCLKEFISKSEETVDLVQSWSFAVNMYAFIACKSVNKVFIGAYRSNFKWKWKSASAINKLKTALNCLAPKELACNSKVSQGQLTTFRRIFFRIGRVHYLPNRLYIPENMAKIVLEYPINSISVGSLLFFKRWDFLIDVIAELNKRGVHIVHRHAGLNGPLKVVLQSKVRQLKIEDKFIFLGQVDDLKEEYDKSHFLIHTSEVEGTPNAVIEAMSNGLPVFTSDCGDVANFVSNENGFVFENYDLIEWCDEIQSRIDDFEIKHMGIHSRRKAESYFDIKFLGDDLIKLYQRVCN